MCPMMLNELNLGAHHLGVDPRLHLFETLMQLFDVVFVGTALRPHGPSSTRLFEYEPRFAVTLGRWVAANRNGFDLVQRTPGLLQAKLNGLGGKARPMLHAAKSLFFGGHQMVANTSWRSRKQIWQIQSALIGGSVGFVAGRLTSKNG